MLGESQTTRSSNSPLAAPGAEGGWLTKTRSAVTAELGLEAAAYSGWVDWMHPVTGEQMGKPRAAGPDRKGSPQFAELVINAERALAEGRRRAGGAARELALYLAHGMDHLAGRDDDTPARRRAMRRRETRWLEACGERLGDIVGP